MTVDDKNFILDPTRWPNWPILPMKNIDRQEIGVMRAVQEELGNTIYLINMWEIKENTDWTKVPKKTYLSIDALLADGWIVD